MKAQTSTTFAAPWLQSRVPFDFLNGETNGPPVPAAGLLNGRTLPAQVRDRACPCETPARILADLLQ
jgi:hypothetical protein